MIDPQSSSPAVLAIEARIIADEQAMTPEQRTERWLRIETEAEKHGAFTRVW